MKTEDIQVGMVLRDSNNLDLKPVVINILVLTNITYYYCAVVTEDKDLEYRIKHVMLSENDLKGFFEASKAESASIIRILDRIVDNADEIKCALSCRL